MMSKACDLAVCVQIAFLPTEGVFLAQILIATCECSAVRDPEKKPAHPVGQAGDGVLAPYSFSALSAAVRQGLDVDHACHEEPCDRRRNDCRKKAVPPHQLFNAIKSCPDPRFSCA